MSILDTSFPDVFGDSVDLTVDNSDSFPISSSTDNSLPNNNSPQIKELFEKPIQTRASSYHDINENLHKTNNYRYVESKVKKFRNELVKQDKAKRFKRTQSLPETSSSTSYNDEKTKSDEVILIKNQILQEEIHLAELEKFHEAAIIKMEENVLNTSFLTNKLDTMKFQLDKYNEKNSMNPIDIIKKVCTPRKSPAIIYPTSTSYGSATCSLSFGENSDSLRNRHSKLKLKRQLKYVRLSEDNDDDNDENDCSTRIFDVPTVSRKKRFKKKVVKAIFGKCLDCDCFKGKGDSTDSAYISH